MKTKSVSLILFSLVASLSLGTTAFADGNYEVCKGYSRNGDAITLVGNYDSQDIVEVNADGYRETYSVDPVDAGDVEEGYTSRDNGGLKVTFYDQDNSASGWSAELGPFRLDCAQH